MTPQDIETRVLAVPSWMCRIFVGLSGQTCVTNVGMIMDEEQQLEGAARGQGDRPPDAVEQPGGRSRQYAARRRGWIREHARDDSFLIFIGVAVTLSVSFVIAYWVISSYRAKPTDPPVPISELYHAPAEEISPGVIRVKYEFPYDTKYYSVDEACPQTADWLRPTLGPRRGTYRMAKQGILVGGKATLRPFFEPGCVSVEADVGLVTGSQITVIIASIYDYRDGDYFRLNLTASRGKDWPSTAQLSRYKDGSRRESTRAVKIPALTVRRDPPLFHKVKLELMNGKLCAYFAPPGAKLQKVCEMQVEDNMSAGKVILTGQFSHTAYDNVVVTGRPHPKFVTNRTKLYHLFNMGAKPESAQPESASPVEEK
jgi:hypothetical protein